MTSTAAQFDPHRTPHAFAQRPHVPTPRPMSRDAWWAWWIGLCHRQPALFEQICSRSEVAAYLAATEAARQQAEAVKKASKGAKKPMAKVTHLNVAAGKVSIKDAFRRTA